MADLSTILKDPNFVNANAATKQAIFDKWAPQDPNFANANAATQDAIRVKFGLAAPAPAEAAPEQPSGIPGPRAIGSQLANQIPVDGRPGPAPDNQPTLSTGQKIYRNIARPVLEPTVEALGAVGGAVLGAPLGPAGIVGGAGLGYGISKEAQKLADIYLGGMTPEEAKTEPVKNILKGATMEAGGQVAGRALGWVGGKIADMRQIPQQKAAALLKKTLATNTALGSDMPDVINALRNAAPGASVAEVTASIKNPTWQAVIRDALERDPAAVKMINQLRDASDEQAVNALAKLASGSTAAEVRGTTEAAKRNLNAITTPMRETAVARANLGKYVADEAAAREANDLAVMAGSGGAVDPARFVAQATGAEKALRSVGVKPLEGAPLADKIAAIPNNPAYAENDLIQGAAARVSDAIRRWTGSNGVLDANALEAIRKNAVNATIAQLRPGLDATAQRNAAAGVMGSIKPLIDDAIEAAGGAGWRQYLAAHSAGMQRIAEKQLSGEALRLWKTDKDAFVRLVQNEAPDVVERFLGPGKYNIATELADSTMDVLRQQAQKRLTEVSVQKQASEGTKALAKIVQQEMPKFRLPSFLNFWASAGNKTLSGLEDAIGKKTMNVITEAMQDPTKAANLLETLPGKERVRVLNILSNPQQWAPGTSAAAYLSTTNMLAPSGQTNQNALSR